MSDLHFILTGIATATAIVLGAAAGVLGLIEYVRDDGFDPDAKRLPPNAKRSVIWLAAMGLGLVMLGMANKAILYFGVSFIEAAAIYWFVARVPLEPPKLS